MYSAVLMLALTAGAETADFGRHGCHSASSCSCPVVVSHGCSSSCHGGLFSRGCHGGGLFAGRGCHGCNGCSYSCSSSCHGGLFSRRSHCSCGPVVTCSACSAPVGCATSAPAKEMPKAEKVGAPKAEQKKTSLETPATSIPTESTTVETVSVARRGILPLFRRN